MRYKADIKYSPYLSYLAIFVANSQTFRGLKCVGLQKTTNMRYEFVFAFNILLNMLIISFIASTDKRGIC